MTKYSYLIILFLQIRKVKLRQPSIVRMGKVSGSSDIHYTVNKSDGSTGANFWVFDYSVEKDNLLY